MMRQLQHSLQRSTETPCFQEAVSTEVMRCGWQVLDRRLRRIAEDLKAAVAEEVDGLAAHGMPQTSETNWARFTQAFPSADTLLDEIQVQPPALLLWDVMAKPSGPQLPSFV
jgi:hypothetical protein